MSNPAIKVEHLSKKYILKQQNKESYTALRDVIANKAKSLFKQPTINYQQAATEEFWALNDISFEVNQGDRLGIIGGNGAGKSTLLKILSRIVTPTKGRITIDGRVASLLEVGTGFHPELSGRENIFLNGSILGMGKAEIQKKFDEIVAFAEVEKFLDTPVKRYSSGMYVRLAFAVAANLDPEILIVDEVLAVGDAEFQKKCLGKMKDVSNEGRTVIFVSHNMGAIQQLCQRGILLEKGRIVKFDSAIKIVQQYLINAYHDAKTGLEQRNTKHVKSVVLKNSNGEYSNCIFIKDSFSIEVELFSEYFIENPALSVGITSLNGDRIATLNTGIQQKNYWGFKGNKKIVFFVKDIMINQGIYELEVNLWNGNNELEQLLGCSQIEILPLDIYGTGILPNKDQGNYLVDVKISIQ